ncbi:diguanylate cyclase [Alicycliphilus denitrificans]|uniref:GGDEF domain-containing protein n=1 Tax=Alicycliphilus denitrificans TaxID=179636 RepID=UPI00384A8EAA
MSTPRDHALSRPLWAPTPPSVHADGAAHRQRWQRRTWQLHQSVLLSHLYAFSLLVGYSLAGYASGPAVAWYGAWVAAGMGFITWAYASGWCHTRRDPGLFVVHQAVSILGVLGLLVAAPQLAFQALVMLIAFSADGFLARSRTSFAVTWVLTLAAAGCAIVWMGPQMRMPTTTLAGQLLTVGVLLGAVARCIGLVTFFRGMQYRLSEALAQIENLVRSDELTGIANRRGIMEVLQRHQAQAGRSGRPLCVALLDVDHFKRINDQHGHDSGDRVLRTLGALLTAHTRAIDSVGRYGGEEFLLAMPDTTAAQAREALERLRARVESTAWAGIFPGASGVTVTIGAAVCQPDESVESAIRRADAALYEGKAAGRNRVVLALPQAAPAVPAGVQV